MVLAAAGRSGLERRKVGLGSGVSKAPCLERLRSPRWLAWPACALPELYPVEEGLV